MFYYNDNRGQPRYVIKNIGAGSSSFMPTTDSNE